MNTDLADERGFFNCFIRENLLVTAFHFLSNFQLNTYVLKSLFWYFH